MALGEIGLFNPAESTYMRPGAYDEALRANALKNAAYLSAMDQWYEQMDETIREFNETLSFKKTVEADTKAIEESKIGLGSRQLDINEEQYKSDLALRTQALKEQTEYQTQDIAVRKTELNWKYGSNYLGSDSASDKAFDFLKSTQKANAAESQAARDWMTKYITGGSSTKVTQSPTYAGTTTPTSGQVNLYSEQQEGWG